MKKPFSDDNILAFFAAFLISWVIQITTGITVRNPLTVVLFVVIFILFMKGNGYSYTKKVPVSFAIIHEFAPLFGSGAIAWLLYREKSAQFSSSFFKLMTFAVLFLGYFVLLGTIISLIFFCLNRKDFVKEKQEKSNAIYVKELGPDGEKKLFYITALVCFAFWLPYFLYEFPGIMTADSLVQYGEIMGMEPWSNHHPVVHTLLIKLFYDLGMLITGKPVIALSFYTVFQMIFMSFCSAAGVIEIIRIEGEYNRNKIIPAMAFFAWVPFNSVFAVTMWKDVPFAGIAMLLSCHLVEMYRKKDEGIRKRDMAVFAILGILFCLLRSNAFIAFIVFAPFFVWTFRKNLVKAVAQVLTCIVCVILIKGPVFNATGIPGPDFVESLSLPLQQVARVLVDEGNVDESEMAMIDAVVDRTYVELLYDPCYADNIKELVRAGHPEVLEANKKDYLGLYLKLFGKNPGKYIASFYDLEGGYFYPDVEYKVADVDGIMSNPFGLYSMPIIGGKFIKLKEILIKLSDFMPVYGWLFSIGMYTIGLFISIIHVVRSRKMILIHVLMLLLIGTLLIAAPVVDFRYAYAVVFTMPVWLALTVSNSIVKGEKDHDGPAD